MLSLWLCRLSTDRIERSRDFSIPACRGGWREAVSALRLPQGSLTRSASPTSLPARGRDEALSSGKRGNAELIVAVDEAAERLGLMPGLALAQARAMYPAIEAIEEDAEADSQLLENIADWCLRYTPLVAVDAPDGSAARHHRLRASLRRRARTGCRSDAERHRRPASLIRSPLPAPSAPLVLPRDYGKPAAMSAARNASYLSPLPLSALRLAPETVAALARVGLKRIGDIDRSAAQPLRPRRFGADLLRQLDRALGREHEPLNPRLPVAPYVAEQRFAEPIAREQDALGIGRAAAGRCIRAGAARRRRPPHRADIVPHRRRGRRIAAGTSAPSARPG